MIMDGLIQSRDTDQEVNACQAGVEDELRRSARSRNPTERMLAFQREEAHKREKRLIHLYEQWKIQACEAREQLKSDIPDNQIAALIDMLEKGRDNVNDIYTEIRNHFTPSSETRRRVDACEAVTKDIVKVCYERMAAIDGDYDSETVRQRLRELLKRDYARSIYGSTVSPSSRHSSDNSSHLSTGSIIAAKRVDAAAELAAREAEYKMLLEEERQNERIRLLEERQNKDLEAQKCELERLKKEIPQAEDVITEIPIGDPEVKRVQTLNVQALRQVNLSDLLSKFSSWYKATQAVARLLRRAKGDKSTIHSTVQEREEARCIILRDLQGQVYPEEIKLLSKGIQLPSRSKLHHMDDFLDQEGILKVGGRLKNVSLPTSQKHPVIIPKNHHITKMIIAHYHQQIQHQGKGLTINEIKSNGYWIPGINRAVAGYVHQCVKCRKLRRSTEEQRMADLPPERVDPSPPFTYCGMDCFGPFSTKQGRKVFKRYGLLFTCLSCRAIHIEMLDDMTTDAFINGLRYFIDIRGAVRRVWCDKGSNFVGAKNELSDSLKLDDASLRTFFYEAMAIVNSRPLTVDNLSDPGSPQPLTPNHLLTMKPVEALPPPGKFIKEDLYALM
ncbi:hypothetical protein QTP70_007773 [Hemibagrus guttatus]|uniref:Integrase zinc-binding domain-containing protein n=1 Tax=Hemibagrus guttatus TaxID=175788 RepID=A0AAE0UW00_9TELE|nr:hypothetical protein QTP70_007773 [Hemibagrus guttatus]